ncbi:MAG: protein translocase subunit SecF [bacterium]|nr:protein translocase subunit SecF [bacterium]
MFVVTYRKFFYIISVVLMAGSIAAISIWGLNMGIDFKGGSILEIEYPEGRPDQIALSKALAPLDLGASIRSTGDDAYLIRMKEIGQEEKSSLLSVLSTLGTAMEKRFDSIGPVLGDEALRKAIFSLVLVIAAIILFIAYAFRKVSEPISSWKYGIVAIIALIHDVLIPTGVFAALGYFAGYEIDTLFITALLVVLGFSVHDTIVVFDRVRENLKDASAKKPFEEIVGESISQTFTRSINTSLTTLLALVVLYFVGGESTQHFTLALIIGMIAGTYSSIFLGSPLLVTIEKWQKKAKK